MPYKRSYPAGAGSSSRSASIKTACCAKMPAQGNTAWSSVPGCPKVQQRFFAEVKVRDACRRSNSAGSTEEVPVGTILSNVNMFKGKFGRKQ